MKRLLPLVCGLAALLLSSTAMAQPAPVEGDYTAAGFTLASGQSLPELRMHYQTAPVGEPALFTNMVPEILMTTSTVPLVTTVLQSGNPLVPLSGLVRWRIASISGGAWKVSFRIHFVAKRR